MYYIRFSLFLILTILISCSSNNKDMFKTGDIIFTVPNYTKEVLSDAINEVTQTKFQTDYTHVGLVIKSENGVEVIHAAPKKGVKREPLQEFTKNISRADLYRLKKRKEIDWNNVLEKGNNLIGLPYDSLFLMNGDSFYCSSFIYEILNDYNLFELEPMTFINPKTGKFHQAWIYYYERLGIEIPEGKLGCNPNGMAKSEELDFIKSIDLH